MDARALLNQILQSGREMAEQGRNMAEDKLGVPEQETERNAMLSGMGKGALAAGALALLLGTKGGRRVGGTALKLGSLAAIGGVAFKAYKDWQAGQSGAEESAARAMPVNALEGPDADKRSIVLIKAMIAAAKADGHIDAEERANINAQVKKLALDPMAIAFIQEETEKPLSAKEIAAEADSQETAAEIYLASRLVIDVDNEPELNYLQDLARELGLAPELVAQLEAAAAA